MEKPVFENPREPFIDRLLVADPSQWPKADSTKCFILKAVNIVGSAMFGSDWRGNELSVLNWPIEPNVAYDSYQKNLTRYREDRAEFAKFHGLTSMTSNEINAHVQSYYEHISRLVELKWLQGEQIAWETNQAATVRLEGVASCLAQKCRDGDISGFYRMKDGGRLNPMVPEDWNVEDIVSKFLAHGGYQRWFNDSPPAQQLPVFIFFDKSEIEATAAMLQHNVISKSATDLSHVSPLSKSDAISISKKTPGRKKGDGSMAAADKPLLAEMRELIDSGKAFSPNGAAKLVGHKAVGGGCFDSKADRLAKRYRASELK